MVPSACTTATSVAAQCQQLFRRRPRLTARSMIQHPADQQEEQQGDGRVEIGVLAAVDRFRKAHAGDQHNPQADRHVHVGAALPQRRQRRGEERPPGIGDRRHRDQRRDPVQQRQCRRPDRIERAALPGPDADRDQHHVACREPGDSHANASASARCDPARRPGPRCRTAPADSPAPRSARPDGSHPRPRRATPGASGEWSC